MNIKGIVDYLQENGLDAVEEIKYKEGILVTRAFYDFDKEELESARACANDECDDLESDKWYEEHFLPYLTDLAIDNVGEIVEELSDEFDVDAQFVSYDITSEEHEYNEFILVFFSKDDEVDIDEVLEELSL